jgi:hypothetical protein
MAQIVFPGSLRVNEQGNIEERRYLRLYAYWLMKELQPYGLMPYAASYEPLPEHGAGILEISSPLFTGNVAIAMYRLGLGRINEAAIVAYSPDYSPEALYRRLSDTPENGRGLLESFIGNIGQRGERGAQLVEVTALEDIAVFGLKSSEVFAKAFTFTWERSSSSVGGGSKG